MAVRKFATFFFFCKWPKECNAKSVACPGLQSADLPHFGGVAAVIRQTACLL